MSEYPTAEDELKTIESVKLSKSDISQHNAKTMPTTARPQSPPTTPAGQSLASVPGSVSVLDACCGGRMFWFDKADDRAVFVDRRREQHVLTDTTRAPGSRVLNVDPDIQADFTALPFEGGAQVKHQRGGEEIGTVTRNWPEGRSTVAFPTLGHVTEGAGCYGFILEWETLILGERSK